MELITLASTAIKLAVPFFTKSGEKIASKAGEDLWTLIKKPFTKIEQKELIEDKTLDYSALENALVEKIKVNKIYQKELENAIRAIQSNDSPQNIQNIGTVNKQINIQNNSGNIQM